MAGLFERYQQRLNRGEPNTVFFTVVILVGLVLLLVG